MHMLSKKVLSSDEMETLRKSRNPTRVVTANGEVHTNEEAQVYVHVLDLFVTVHILEDTPAVLFLGKLCDEHGRTYGWASSQQLHPTKQGKKISCKTENVAPLVVPVFSSSSGTSSSSTSPPWDSSSTSSSPAPERRDEPAPGNWRDSPKTQRRGITVEPRTTVCETFWNGWESSQKVSKIQKCLHPHTFETPQIRNVPQKWLPGSSVFFSLPQRPKLRGLQANQDYKGSLQKTHWRSSTSSRKVW